MQSEGQTGTQDWSLQSLQGSVMTNGMRGCPFGRRMDSMIPALWIQER